MRGLKVLLFINFFVFVVYGLLLVFFPSLVAQIQMGPQDASSARYFGVTYLALSAAVWYAFRNPIKNVAVVRAIITLYVLSILVALYQGITGAEPWITAGPSIIATAILTALLAYFYPRGESAT